MVGRMSELMPLIWVVCHPSCCTRHSQHSQDSLDADKGKVPLNDCPRDGVIWW